MAHNLLVAKPRHVTTLARFSTLRCLSLMKVEYLSIAEVSRELTWPFGMRESYGSGIITSALRLRCAC